MATDKVSVRCCIAGGGPAGIMLGLLLARASVCRPTPCPLSVSAQDSGEADRGRFSSRACKNAQRVARHGRLKQGQCGEERKNVHAKA